MSLIVSVKRLIPIALKQPVRDYLDARAARLQPRLNFDSTNLRRVSHPDLTSIMNDPMIGAACTEDHAGIARAFDAGQITGAVNPGDRRALYHLVGHFKPRCILEIGTHVGASSVYIASALRRYVDQGSLFTADIIDVNGPGGAWRPLGLRQPPSAILSDLGLERIVTFINQPAAAVLESSDRHFDMIFLDGDHTEAAVYREISAALSLLNPNGLIVLHDFYPGGKPLAPVGGVVFGPAAAAVRIESETDALAFLPLGNLPWPTKGGSNVTSLALVSKR